MLSIQIPDWVFQTPLHGVRLSQCADENRFDLKSEYKYKLRLGFPESILPPKTRPLWRLQDQGERYASTVELFEEPERKLLQIECEGKGTFEFVGDEMNITWQSEGTSFEHYLQTLGMSLWLELQGVLCIHANAIATDVGVIGLIAPSQTGKTTLTAALAARGMAMMTDDMMAVHQIEMGPKVFSGWPQLRMWPEIAQHFIENVDDMQRVHKRFEKRLVKLSDQNSLTYSSKSGMLRSLYLLERVENNKASICIEVVTAAESIECLLQNSMLADAYRPLGIESARLKALALILGEVRVKRITYPSGKERLTEVCEAIEADLLKR
ncbi:hypothetical protein MNBD_GAMMA17-803 [hydrothermal vent metagenome]|uniref:HPr kinase/phosphorylase C-terminal domain-containing protein n=1 Tax=hydrothermal vent metagenome TaxID=652676 RepID=A0A3B1A8C0_9ZZZZ